MEKAGWLVVKNIQTNLNGWTDLTCYRNGVTVFIECKGEGINNVRPLQTYRHQQIRKQGFEILIINDLKQIYEFIENCPIL